VEALATHNDLEFRKFMYFLNLIVESYVFDVVLALNGHQQSRTYVGSIIDDCINFNVCFHS